MVIGLQVGTGLSKLRVVTTLLHLTDQKKPTVQTSNPTWHPVPSVLVQKKVAHRWQTSAATVHPTGCATAQEAAERGERASEQVAEKMYQEDTTGIFLGKHAIGYSSTIILLTFGVDIKFIKGLYQGIIKKDWM